MLQRKTLLMTMKMHPASPDGDERTLQSFVHVYAGTLSSQSSSVGQSPWQPASQFPLLPHHPPFPLLYLKTSQYSLPTAQPHQWPAPDDIFGKVSVKPIPSTSHANQSFRDQASIFCRAAAALLLDCPEQWGFGIVGPGMWPSHSRSCRIH